MLFSKAELTTAANDGLPTKQAKYRQIPPKTGNTEDPMMRLLRRWMRPEPEPEPDPEPDPDTEGLNDFFESVEERVGDPPKCDRCHRERTWVQLSISLMGKGVTCWEQEECDAAVAEEKATQEAGQ